MTAWTWERNGGVWILVSAFAMLILVSIMALNVGGARSDVERVAMNGAGYMGLGMTAPAPQSVEWPERTIPYAKTPPSFMSPEFPPLPEAAPPAPRPADWREPFWAEHQRR